MWNNTNSGVDHTSSGNNLSNVSSVTMAGVTTNSSNNNGSSNAAAAGANNLSRSIAVLAAYNADVSANAAAFAAAADNARYAAALHHAQYAHANQHHQQQQQQQHFAATIPTLMAPVEHRAVYHASHHPSFAGAIDPFIYQQQQQQQQQQQYNSYSRGKPASIVAMQQQQARTSSGAAAPLPPSPYNNRRVLQENEAEDDDDYYSCSPHSITNTNIQQQQQQQQPLNDNVSISSSPTSNIVLADDENDNTTSSNTSSSSSTSTSSATSSSDSDDDRAIRTLATTPLITTTTTNNNNNKKKKPAAAKKQPTKTNKKPPPLVKATTAKQRKVPVQKQQKANTKKNTLKNNNNTSGKDKVNDSSGHLEQKAVVLDSLVSATISAATTTTKQQQRRKPSSSAKQPTSNNSNKKTTSNSMVTAAVVVPSSAASEDLVAVVHHHHHTNQPLFRDKTLERRMSMAEYENVTALFQQFCQLPLLAEFTKPLATLHPELATLYNKITSHPMDLSKICSSIHAKKYKYTRHVQLDLWRLCSNCILFHSDTRSIKENVAIPSFVSIALHLRDYFNALWEEYMIPSSSSNNKNMNDNNVVVEAVEVLTTTSSTAEAAIPVFCTPKATTATSDDDDDDDDDDGDKNSIKAHTATNNKHNPVCSMQHPLHVFQTRARNRKFRYTATENISLSQKACYKAATSIQYFLDNGGRVDLLDVDAIIDCNNTYLSSSEEALVIAKIIQMKKCLVQCGDSGCAKNSEENGDSSDDDDDDITATMQISIHEIQDHFHSITNLPCVTSCSCSSFQTLLKERLDRLLHKLIVPLYEVGCRGVNQSSIWGCMAAAIWARESSRKPYWPALVLGILAPDDQKEDWHCTLTERNEGRFPEKLRMGLSAGKKKAAMTLEKNKGKEEQMSYFLVEFLGKHQFTWVREADILENFDPKQDPNEALTVLPGFEGSKKQRKPVSHSISDTPVYNTAVQECQWAVEEFDMQVRDPCGDMYSMDDDDEDEDKDNDGEDDDLLEGLSKYNFAILAQASVSSDEDDDDNDDSSTIDETDDEGEALYATEGLIDLTLEGRKRFTALSSSAKRQREAASRKEKAEQAKREKAAAAKSRRPRGSSASRKGGSVSTPAPINCEISASTYKKKRKASSEKVDQQQSSSRKRPKFERNTTGASTTRGGGGGGKKRSNIILDKKGRARAKVRAYVTKLIQKGLLIPSAAHTTSSGGVGFGAGAGSGGGNSIDTSGLMGVALAFRAAAGEIPGADPREEHEIRPWDFVKNTASPAPTTFSRERCKLLKRQLELLQEAFATMEMEHLKRKQILESCLDKNQRKEHTNAVVVKPSTTSENGHSGSMAAAVKKRKASAIATENGSTSAYHETTIPNKSNIDNNSKEENNCDYNHQDSTDLESDAETEDEAVQDNTIQW